MRIDVNKPQKEGATPFLIACQEGKKEVVSLLLRIDINKPNNNGATPFFIACQQGHKEVVSLLLADIRIDVNKPATSAPHSGWPHKKATCQWFSSSWPLEEKLTRRPGPLLALLVGTTRRC